MDSIGTLLGFANPYGEVALTAANDRAVLDSAALGSADEMTLRKLLTYHARVDQRRGTSTR
jgi:hypothetical protein